MKARSRVKCTKCLVRKRTADFYKKGERLYSWCKPCFNAYCIRRWIARKLKYVELLGNRCADCERSYHYAVYDFHHLEAKDFSWQRLRLRPDAEIRRELSKCTLLCANCHRLRHANET